MSIQTHVPLDAHEAEPVLDDPKIVVATTRIPRELHSVAKALAEFRQISLSEVIHLALATYVNDTDLDEIQKELEDLHKQRTRALESMRSAMAAANAPRNGPPPPRRSASSRRHSKVAGPNVGP